jgi:hypothetical protein
MKGFYLSLKGHQHGEDITNRCRRHLQRKFNQARKAKGSLPG